MLRPPSSLHPPAGYGIHVYTSVPSVARDTDAPVLDALAGWAGAVAWEEIPDAAALKIVDSVVDTVAVAIAGANHEDFAPVRAYLDATGLGAGSASMWGSGAPAHAATAAFANATAGHLLDFDDVHYLIHGHPSTVLLPAVMAVAEECDADGSTLLRGFAAGLGVMTAIARAFGPEHYSRGWHSTSTCGVIGAAAGAAVVLGLPRDRIRNAMAIAVSRASGVRANFGTLLKPMHAGFAARDGVEAALLSAHGVNAAPDPLTAPLGGLALFGDGSWQPDLTRLLGDADAAATGLGLKLYPCCRGSHYAVDAALDVRESLPAGVAVDRIEIVVPLGAKTALIYDDPRTGLQGKFSLPYTVATALRRGLPLIEHFADDAVHDPGVRGLMARMNVVEDASQGDLSSTMTGRYAEITVDTADGGRHRARVDDARGSSTRPLTSTEVDTKFLSAVAPWSGAGGATTLLGELRSLPTLRGVRGLFTAE